MKESQHLISYLCDAFKHQRPVIGAAYGIWKFLDSRSSSPFGINVSKSISDTRKNTIAIYDNIDLSDQEVKLVANEFEKIIVLACIDTGIELDDKFIPCFKKASNDYKGLFYDFLGSKIRSVKQKCLKEISKARKSGGELNKYQKKAISYKKPSLSLLGKRSLNNEANIAKKNASTAMDYDLVAVKRVCINEPLGLFCTVSNFTPTSENNTNLESGSECKSPFSEAFDSENKDDFDTNTFFI